MPTLMARRITGAHLRPILGGTLLPRLSFTNEEVSYHRRPDLLG